jgi:hypothetical protein
LHRTDGDERKEFFNGPLITDVLPDYGIVIVILLTEYTRDFKIADINVSCVRSSIVFLSEMCPMKPNIITARNY